MHPCNVILHGFSYSACYSWVQKKTQYEKYSNNGNATPIKLIEMKQRSINICMHCKINLELGFMEVHYIITDL